MATDRCEDNREWSVSFLSYIHNSASVKMSKLSEERLLDGFTTPESLLHLLQGCSAS